MRFTTAAVVLLFAVGTGGAHATEVIKLQNRGTGRCLNIHRGRADFEGGPVTSYSCADTVDQEWRLTQLGGGWVRLRNRGTGRCLNIHRGQADFEGGPVTSYSCADTVDQEWKMIWLSDGDVKLRNHGTGRCLNIHRGQADFEGGPVTSYSCADTPDQKWKLIRVSGGVSCRGAEALGSALSGRIVHELNTRLAGSTKHLGHFKTLRIDRIRQVSFDGCDAAVKADVTLKRKVRRNAQGPVILKARVTHFDAAERVVCVDQGRVTSAKLSHTTRLGERVYRWVANKVLPGRRCFR